MSDLRTLLRKAIDQGGRAMSIALQDEIDAALSEPAQEPVAFMTQDRKYVAMAMNLAEARSDPTSGDAARIAETYTVPLYAAPAPASQSDAKVDWSWIRSVLMQGTIEKMDKELAQRDEIITDLRAALLHANACTDAAEARVKELLEKENAADMCLQSVHEARKIIKEHLGGNCAFLDDDLVRWVVRGLDEIKEERDALRARLEEIRKQPTVSHTAEPYPRELIHRPDLST